MALYSMQITNCAYTLNGSDGVSGFEYADIQKRPGDRFILYAYNDGNWDPLYRSQCDGGTCTYKSTGHPNTPKFGGTLSIDDEIYPPGTEFFLKVIPVQSEQYNECHPNCDWYDDEPMEGALYVNEQNAIISNGFPTLQDRVTHGSFRFQSTYNYYPGCPESTSCNFSDGSTIDDGSCYYNNQQTWWYDCDDGTEGCDCNNICGGSTDYDCNNDCGGTAELDDCEICSGGNSGHEADSDKDCAGVCMYYTPEGFGLSGDYSTNPDNNNAFVDDCGECVWGTTGVAPSCYCHRSFEDIVGDDSFDQPSTGTDCPDWVSAGNTCGGGSSNIDDCDRCNGNNEDMDCRLDSNDPNWQYCTFNQNDYTWIRNVDGYGVECTYGQAAYDCAINPNDPPIWCPDGPDVDGICCDVDGDDDGLHCGSERLCHPPTDNYLPFETWNNSSNVTITGCDGFEDSIYACYCDGDVDDCGICDGQNFFSNCSDPVWVRENGDCTYMDCNGTCSEESKTTALDRWKQDHDCPENQGYNENMGSCQPNDNLAFWDDCSVCSGGQTGHDKNDIEECQGGSWDSFENYPDLDCNCECKIGTNEYDYQHSDGNTTYGLNWQDDCEACWPTEYDDDGSKFKPACHDGSTTGECENYTDCLSAALDCNCDCMNPEGTPNSGYWKPFDDSSFLNSCGVCIGKNTDYSCLDSDCGTPVGTIPHLSFQCEGNNDCEEDEVCLNIYEHLRENDDFNQPETSGYNYCREEETSTYGGLLEHQSETSYDLDVTQGMDCEGVCDDGTPAVIDGCGVCTGGTTGVVANSDMDCRGTVESCFGTYYTDQFGLCCNSFDPNEFTNDCAPLADAVNQYNTNPINEVCQVDLGYDGINDACTACDSCGATNFADCNGDGIANDCLTNYDSYHGDTSLCDFNNIVDIGLNGPRVGSGGTDVDIVEGNTIRKGSSFTITWTPLTIVNCEDTADRDYVTISLDGVSNDIDIVTNLPDTGTYTWLIPTDSTIDEDDTYTILIEKIKDGNVNGSSSFTFNVSPANFGCMDFNASNYSNEYNIPCNVNGIDNDCCEFDYCPDYGRCINSTSTVCTDGGTECEDLNVDVFKAPGMSLCNSSITIDSSNEYNSTHCNKAGTCTGTCAFNPSIINFNTNGTALSTDEDVDLSFSFDVLEMSDDYDDDDLGVQTFTITDTGGYIDEISSTDTTGITRTSTIEVIENASGTGGEFTITIGNSNLGTTITTAGIGVSVLSDDDDSVISVNYSTDENNTDTTWTSTIAVIDIDELGTGMEGYVDCSIVTESFPEDDFTIDEDENTNTYKCIHNTTNDNFIFYITIDSRYISPGDLGILEYYGTNVSQNKTLYKLHLYYQNDTSGWGSAQIITNTYVQLVDMSNDNPLELTSTINNRNPSDVTATSQYSSVNGAGTNVELYSTGNDPENGVLTYEWIQLSGGDNDSYSVTINNSNSATANFDSPAVTQSGNIKLDFQLTITDEVGGQSTATVSVDVYPIIGCLANSWGGGYACNDDCTNSDSADNCTDGVTHHDDSYCNDTKCCNDNGHLDESNQCDCNLNTDGGSYGHGFCGTQDLGLNNENQPRYTCDFSIDDCNDCGLTNQYLNVCGNPTTDCHITYDWGQDPDFYCENGVGSICDCEGNQCDDCGVCGGDGYTSNTSFNTENGLQEFTSCEDTDDCLFMDCSTDCTPIRFGGLIPISVQWNYPTLTITDNSLSDPKLLSGVAMMSSFVYIDDFEDSALQFLNNNIFFVQNSPGTDQWNLWDIYDVGIDKEPIDPINERPMIAVFNSSNFREGLHPILNKSNLTEYIDNMDDLLKIAIKSGTEGGAYLDDCSICSEGDTGVVENIKVECRGSHLDCACRCPDETPDYDGSCYEYGGTGSIDFNDNCGRDTCGVCDGDNTTCWGCKLSGTNNDSNINDFGGYRKVCNTHDNISGDGHCTNVIGEDVDCNFDCTGGSGTDDTTCCTWSVTYYYDGDGDGLGCPYDCDDALEEGIVPGLTSCPDSNFPEPPEYCINASGDSPADTPEDNYVDTAGEAEDNATNCICVNTCGDDGDGSCLDICNVCLGTGNSCAGCNDGTIGVGSSQPLNYQAWNFDCTELYGVCSDFDENNPGIPGTCSAGTGSWSDETGLNFGNTCYGPMDCPLFNSSNACCILPSITVGHSGTYIDGSTVTITIATNFESSQEKKVELWTGESQIKTIVTGKTDNNSITWTVPDDLDVYDSTNYFIRVTVTDGNQVGAYGDSSTFTLDLRGCMVDGNCRNILENDRATYQPDETWCGQDLSVYGGDTIGNDCNEVCHAGPFEAGTFAFVDDCGVCSQGNTDIIPNCYIDTNWPDFDGYYNGGESGCKEIKTYDALTGVESTLSCGAVKTYTSGCTAYISWDTEYDTTDSSSMSDCDTCDYTEAQKFDGSTKHDEVHVYRDVHLISDLENVDADADGGVDFTYSPVLTSSDTFKIYRENVYDCAGTCFGTAYIDSGLSGDTECNSLTETQCTTDDCYWNGYNLACEKICDGNGCYNDSQTHCPLGASNPDGDDTFATTIDWLGGFSFGGCVMGEVPTNWPCMKDCNDDWGGSAYLDSCGFCVGGQTDNNSECGTSPCEYDWSRDELCDVCEGECDAAPSACLTNGTKIAVDETNCPSGEGNTCYKWNDNGQDIGCYDCFGEKNGTAVFDNCGICSPLSQNNDYYKDCNNKCPGETGYYSPCYNDTSTSLTCGRDACNQCNGTSFDGTPTVWSDFTLSEGGASIGISATQTTNATNCTNPYTYNSSYCPLDNGVGCNGVCDSEQVFDECYNCNGDAYNVNCVVSALTDDDSDGVLDLCDDMDCAGVCSNDSRLSSDGGIEGGTACDDNYGWDVHAETPSCTMLSVIKIENQSTWEWNTCCLNDVTYYDECDICGGSGYTTWYYDGDGDGVGCPAYDCPQEFSVCDNGVCIGGTNNGLACITADPDCPLYNCPNFAPPNTSVCPYHEADLTSNGWVNVAGETSPANCDCVYNTFDDCVVCRETECSSDDSQWNDIPLTNNPCEEGEYPINSNWNTSCSGCTDETAANYDDNKTINYGCHPATPVLSAEVGDDETTQINLSWTYATVEGENESFVTFDVYRKPSDGSYELISENIGYSDGGGTHQDTAPLHNTSYTYKVVVKNEFNSTGVDSNEPSITTNHLSGCMTSTACNYMCVDGTDPNWGGGYTTCDSGSFGPVTNDPGGICDYTSCCNNQGTWTSGTHCDCDDTYCGQAGTATNFNTEPLNTCNLSVDDCGNCSGDCSGTQGTDLTCGESGNNVNFADCAYYCCDGSCNGDDAYLDSCGVCSEGGTGIDANKCGSSFVYSDPTANMSGNVCVAANFVIGNNDTSNFDHCGKCGGNNVCGGTMSYGTTYRECGTGWSGSDFDCSGVCFGDAVTDDCDLCSGQDGASWSTSCSCVNPTYSIACANDIHSCLGDYAYNWGEDCDGNCPSVGRTIVNAWQSTYYGYGTPHNQSGGGVNICTNTNTPAQWCPEDLSYLDSDGKDFCNQCYPTDDGNCGGTGCEFCLPNGTNSTTCDSCSDCAGVANGNARLDSCGVCVGGMTGNACPNGVVGNIVCTDLGNSYYKDCNNECTEAGHDLIVSLASSLGVDYSSFDTWLIGDNSGTNPGYGDAIVDGCGNCVYGTTFCTAAQNTCHGNTPETCTEQEGVCHYNYADKGCGCNNDGSSDAAPVIYYSDQDNDGVGCCYTELFSSHFICEGGRGDIETARTHGQTLGEVQTSTGLDYWVVGCSENLSGVACICDTVLKYVDDCGECVDREGICTDSEGTVLDYSNSDDCLTNVNNEGIIGTEEWTVTGTEPDGSPGFRDVCGQCPRTETAVFDGEFHSDGVCTNGTCTYGRIDESCPTTLDSECNTINLSYGSTCDGDMINGVCNGTTGGVGENWDCAQVCIKHNLSDLGDAEMDDCSDCYCFIGGHSYTLITNGAKCEIQENGTNPDKLNYNMDCNGYCHEHIDSLEPFTGKAFVDNCGFCSGGNTIFVENWAYDCVNDCFGLTWDSIFGVVSTQEVNSNKVIRFLETDDELDFSSTLIADDWINITFSVNSQLNGNYKIYQLHVGTGFDVLHNWENQINNINDTVTIKKFNNQCGELTNWGGEPCNNLYPLDAPANPNQGEAFVNQCGYCVDGDTGTPSIVTYDDVWGTAGAGLQDDILVPYGQDCFGVCNAAAPHTTYNCSNQGWKPTVDCGPYSDECREDGVCLDLGAVLDTCQVCSGGATGIGVNVDIDSCNNCFGGCSGTSGDNASCSGMGVSETFYASHDGYVHYADCDFYCCDGICDNLTTEAHLSGTCDTICVSGNTGLNLITIDESHTPRMEYSSQNDLGYGPFYAHAYTLVAGCADPLACTDNEITDRYTTPLFTSTDDELVYLGNTYYVYVEHDGSGDEYADCEGICGGTNIIDDVCGVCVPASGNPENDCNCCPNDSEYTHNEANLSCRGCKDPNAENYNYKPGAFPGSTQCTDCNGDPTDCTIDFGCSYGTITNVSIANLNNVGQYASDDSVIHEGNTYTITWDSFDLQEGDSTEEVNIILRLNPLEDTPDDFPIASEVMDDLSGLQSYEWTSPTNFAAGDDTNYVIHIEKNQEKRVYGQSSILELVSTTFGCTNENTDNYNSNANIDDYTECTSGDDTTCCQWNGCMDVCANNNSQTGYNQPCLTDHGHNCNNDPGDVCTFNTPGIISITPSVWIVEPGGEISAVLVTNNNECNDSSITWNQISGPEGVEIDITNGVKNPIFTFPDYTNGTYVFQVSVTNGATSPYSETVDSEDITLYTNNIPTIDSVTANDSSSPSIVDITDGSATNVTLSVTATDVDTNEFTQDDLTYEWERTDPNFIAYPISIADNTLFETTFSMPDLNLSDWDTPANRTFTFNITVDDGLEHDEDTVNVIGLINEQTCTNQHASNYVSTCDDSSYLAYGHICTDNQTCLFTPHPVLVVSDTSPPETPESGTPESTITITYPDSLPWPSELDTNGPDLYTITATYTVTIVDASGNLKFANYCDSNCQDSELTWTVPYVEAVPSDVAYTVKLEIINSQGESAYVEQGLNVYDVDVYGCTDSNAQNTDCQEGYYPSDPYSSECPGVGCCGSNVTINTNSEGNNICEYRPSVPTNFTATANTDPNWDVKKLNLSWDNVTTNINGDAISGVRYDLIRTTGGDTTLLSDTFETSFTDIGLGNYNTQYSYKVIAKHTPGSYDSHWYSEDATTTGTTNVNQPPTLTMPAEQHGVEGTNVNLNATAEDPDGFSLTYEWTTEEGVTLSDTDIEDTSLTLPSLPDDSDVVSYDVTLLITDEAGGTDTDNVTVNNYPIWCTDASADNINSASVTGEETYSLSTACPLVNGYQNCCTYQVQNFTATFDNQCGEDYTQILDGCQYHVDFTWTDFAANTNGYTIYESRDSGVNWSVIGNLSAGTTTHTIPIIDDWNETRQYKITSFNVLNMESTDSDIQDVLILGQPIEACNATNACNHEPDCELSSFVCYNTPGLCNPTDCTNNQTDGCQGDDNSGNGFGDNTGPHIVNDCDVCIGPTTYPIIDVDEDGTQMTDFTPYPTLTITSYGNGTGTTETRYLTRGQDCGGRCTVDEGFDGVCPQDAGANVCGLDGCSVCDGESSYSVENECTYEVDSNEDGLLEGTWDDGGYCPGAPTPTYTLTNYDCDNVCFGGATIDDCGYCCGGTTGVPCSSWTNETTYQGVYDCYGVCFGTSYYNDGCLDQGLQICIEGTTGNLTSYNIVDIRSHDGTLPAEVTGFEVHSDNTNGNNGLSPTCAISSTPGCYYSVTIQHSMDCNGVCNGTAFIDDCGICSGGTTGVAPSCNCGGGNNSACTTYLDNGTCGNGTYDTPTSGIIDDCNNCFGDGFVGYCGDGNCNDMDCRNTLSGCGGSHELDTNDVCCDPITWDCGDYCPGNLNYWPTVDSTDFSYICSDGSGTGCDCNDVCGGGNTEGTTGLEAYIDDCGCCVGGTTNETTTCWSGYPTNSEGLSNTGDGNQPTHQINIFDCHAFDGLEDGTPCEENWVDLGCGCFLPPPVMYWPDVDNDLEASGEGHYYCECIRDDNDKACNCISDNICTSWNHS